MGQEKRYSLFTPPLDRFPQSPVDQRAEDSRKLLFLVPPKSLDVSNLLLISIVQNETAVAVATVALLGRLVLFCSFTEY